MRATSSPGWPPILLCITKKLPVLGFLRFQIGVLSPSRVQVGLKFATVASVNWWKPVPSTLMMQMALSQLTVTGSSL